MAKYINKYTNIEAYNADDGKQYPNVSYLIDQDIIKWEKNDPVHIVAVYNVTSTSEATNLLGSSTGITYQIIDGVRQDTVQTTYTFDTLGKHTVKYKLDGTSISDSAFYYCDGLTSVTIPNSVTSIGNAAFYNCTGLTSVTIPNSVTSIGSGAFSNCTGLTSITIPNSVTSFGENVFRGTAWYNNQPDGLVYAGKVAYKYKGTMPSGTSIVLKEETKVIAGAAFQDCTGLTSVTIGNSVTSIGNAAFYNCTGLTSVTIPNSVTTIGDLAFLGCSGLTSITIPNSVTEIGVEAFEGCSGLTSITIPNSVTEIGDYVFYNCSGLTSITIQATTPPTLGGTDAFNGTNANLIIYVPAESVDAYKTATNWSSLVSRIQPIVA